MSSFVLASASPRRSQLLGSAGLDFEVIPSAVPEQVQPGESADRYVRRLAAAKARDVAARSRATGDRRPVLAADTTVVVDGAVLEKPADEADARRMLGLLSGREHQVITAFCVIDDDGREHLDAVTTEVRFKPLTEEELDWYIGTDEWRDKAGAYAIQGRAACLVPAIIGSYTNVVGLPLCESVQALRRAGVRPTRTP